MARTATQDRIAAQLAEGRPMTTRQLADAGVGGFSTIGKALVIMADAGEVVRHVEGRTTFWGLADDADHVGGSNDAAGGPGVDTAPVSWDGTEEYAGITYPDMADEVAADRADMEALAARYAAERAAADDAAAVVIPADWDDVPMGDPADDRPGPGRLDAYLVANRQDDDAPAVRLARVTDAMVREARAAGLTVTPGDGWADVQGDAETIISTLSAYRMVAAYGRRATILALQNRVRAAQGEAPSPAPAPAGDPDLGVARQVAPAAKVNAVTGLATRARGELRADVLAYLTANPQAEVTPARLARALGGRSNGAVLKGLNRLVADGAAVLVSEAPRTYRLA